MGNTEREAAKKAKVPLLYADASSKEDIEGVAKAVVWGLQPSLAAQVGSKTPPGRIWLQLSDELSLLGECTECLSRWRRPRLPPRTLCSKMMRGGARSSPPLPPGSLSNSSSSSSPPSGAVSSDSDSASNADEWSGTEPPDSPAFVVLTWGSEPWDKLHSLNVCGDLPLSSSPTIPCAKKTETASAPRGVGREGLRSVSRPVCKHCLRSFPCLRQALLPS